MRDIKFRIWDKQEKEMMFEGFHIFGEITLFNAITQHAFETKGERSSLERYNDFEIMQFIGLKDLQGKDIYEGDIDKSGCVVLWSDEYCMFCLHYKPLYQKEFKISGYPIDVSRIEIVGNIHANPELIK